jgi:hypothetical protein
MLARVKSETLGNSFPCAIKKFKTHEVKSKPKVEHTLHSVFKKNKQFSSEQLQQNPNCLPHFDV